MTLDIAKVLAKTVESLSDVTIGEYSGTVHHELQLRDQSIYHAQRFEAGRLVDWRLHEPGPWSLVLHDTWFSYVPDQGPVPTETPMFRRDGQLFPLAPFDDLADPTELKETYVAGGQFRVLLEIGDSPVGTVRTLSTFREGSRVSISIADAETDADVFTRWGWGTCMANRRGDVTTLEAASDSGYLRIGPDRGWSTLVLLYGLIRQNGLVDHLKFLPQPPSELVGYGKTVNDPQWCERVKYWAAQLDELCGLESKSGQETRLRGPFGLPKRHYAQSADPDTGSADAVEDIPFKIQVNTIEADQLLESLVSSCRAGWQHTCAQVFVTLEGETVLDFSAGTTVCRSTMDPQTISALYCTPKPAVASAILNLVEVGEVGLDQPVGELVDSIADWMKPLTVAHLLLHSAGMHMLDRVTYKMLPPEIRWEWVAAAKPSADFRPGVDSAYAEVGSWHLLGRIIESVTSSPWDQFCERTVLDGYGCSTEDLDLVMSRERIDCLVATDQLSINVDRTWAEPVPLFAEATPAWACDSDAAIGAYGNARGVAGLYTGILNDRNGDGVVLPADLARSLTTPRFPMMVDPVLRRRVAWSMGCACPPLPLEVLEEGSDSFGHASEGGLSFGIVLPRLQLVIAAVFNGCLDGRTGLHLRAGNLVAGISDLVSKKINR